jgi:prolyl-tRNA editing enzyme YbaK/EbsC (Cys-tRNA(Pro) deacylase)
MNATYNNIVSLLTKYKIPYLVSNHEPVYNSNDIVGILNTDIDCESKSIALDIEGKIYIFTIPILERLSVDKVKQITNVNKIAFLKTDKIQSKLGVPLGALSPFGYTNNIQCYVSAEFLKRPYLNFNPGLNDTTFQITPFGINKLVSLGVIKIID